MPSKRLSGPSVEHGIMVNYETLGPVPGSPSPTTDCQRPPTTAVVWSLRSRRSALQPTVTSGAYSKLLFPVSTAAGADINFSTVGVRRLEHLQPRRIIALGWIRRRRSSRSSWSRMPSCASAVGGTLSVLSPSGASISYFNAQSARPEPCGHVVPARPVAEARRGRLRHRPEWDALAPDVSHPTCTQVPFPVAYRGAVLGRRALDAAEPGGVNAALVLFLE